MPSKDLSPGTDNCINSWNILFRNFLLFKTKTKHELHIFACFRSHFFLSQTPVQFTRDQLKKVIYQRKCLRSHLSFICTTGIQASAVASSFPFCIWIKPMLFEKDSTWQHFYHQIQFLQILPICSKLEETLSLSACSQFHGGHEIASSLLSSKPANRVEAQSFNSRFQKSS